LGMTFDYITDYGMSEHCTDLYQLYLNIDNHAKAGTLVFQVNPLVGSWPGHGVFYREPDFYTEFCKIADYELLHTRVGYVLGNSIDGFNVYGIMRKRSDAPFISRRQFLSLPFAQMEASQARTQVPRRG
jgi:hypothetical protein